MNKQYNDMSKFTDDYNALCDQSENLGYTLKDLTDSELHLWIAGKTVLFGRSLDAAMKNADAHMENRAEAEKQFGIQQAEDLLGVI